MRARLAGIALGLVLGVAASLGAAACSSAAPTPFQTLPDGGVDATVAVDDADARGERPDRAIPLDEDGGADAREGGPVGRCTPLQGPACDLVAQDCPRATGGADQQCVAARGADGGFTTACSAVSAQQSIPKGSPCCVGGGGDPCLKGLVCVGGDRCPDAGEPPGRCSPICCDGDDGVCGSDRDGVPGRCNLLIVGGAPQQDLYQVCSYATVCRPLGLAPCPGGQTCLVTDTSGSARCSRVFAPDGGAGAGHLEPCAAANACADGLVCLSSGDAGARCEYLCHVQGTATPFDAGALSNAPGRGGCPQNKPTCRPVPNLYPAWLGICD